MKSIKLGFKIGTVVFFSIEALNFWITVDKAICNFIDSRKGTSNDRKKEEGAEE